jgi:hypothetical protein
LSHHDSRDDQLSKLARSLLVLLVLLMGASVAAAEGRQVAITIGVAAMSSSSRWRVRSKTRVIGCGMAGKGEPEAPEWIMQAFAASRPAAATPAAQ